MEAMREMNGLRGRKPSKPVDPSRVDVHQAQKDHPMHAAASIETNEKETDDKIRPQTTVQPTGSDSPSRDISDEDAEEAPPVAEDVSSKGHSLIVKSRDSKNKVSLVIKPIRSSTEEPLESSTEETPESMSEDHVKSSSEESPKPAENNESSSSRPMEHGSVQRENDLLSKLVDDTT